MIGYPIVFRCCECTVEEQTMEHLEKHIWSRHLQAFPFKCAQCDYPAISAASLLEHFEQQHAQVPAVEFKRNLEDEKRFRKMIAESIAIEYDENAQADSNTQMTVLQPLIPQGATQIMLLPSSSSQYEAIVDHRGSQHDDFGVLEDDDNVEEMLDEDDDDYIDELGNPVFIGAHDDPAYILEEDLPPSVRPSTSYHLKYLRTRRMDKLIDNVVVNAAQRSSTDSTTTQTNSSHLVNEGNVRKIGKFNCDQCSKTFKFQSKLEEHRRTHLGLRPFPCPYCPRGFCQKGALKTHLRLHTGERPFVCQWECGREFTSASARTHHEKTHSGERPYLCSVCGKAFTKNSHVLRHLKNIHKREIMTSSDQPGDVVIRMRPEPDIEPRGKESGVVHEIVEQIHEEKFAETKLGFELTSL